MLENIILALRGIKNHKLRSFLTMLGIIIGIASIIGIVSIVQGTNAKLEKSLVGSGNNVTTLALSSDGVNAYPFDGDIPSGVSVVSEEQIDAIGKIRGVVSASTYRQKEFADVYYQNKSISSKVFGVSDTFFRTVQYKVISGRDFTADEYRSGIKAAILEKKAAENYFPTESPVGKILEIGSEPFLVIGVAEDTKKKKKQFKSYEEYKENQDADTTLNIYVPENVWPIIYGFDVPQSVAVHVESTPRIFFVSRRAANILNQSVSSAELKYSSLSSAQDQNNMQEITNTISMMLLGIASLSLLVGGIGVMNIMLVSVTERTSEIGLKKALGAKARSILLQFITESVVLTGMGGIMGVILGIGLARVISWTTGMEFGISVPWILISVLFSVVIGVIFGVMPAYRAAKLNPIEALRRE